MRTLSITEIAQVSGGTYDHGCEPPKKECAPAPAPKSDSCHKS